MSPTVLALVALGAPAFAALVSVLPAVRRYGWPAALLCIGGSLAALTAALLLVIGAVADPAPVTLTVPWLESGSKVIAEVGVRVDPVSAAMLAVVAIVALSVQSSRSAT